MKQTVSKQMGGDLNAQQFAVELRLLRAVQSTLYDYMEGFPLAEVLEVRSSWAQLLKKK